MFFIPKLNQCFVEPLNLFPLQNQSKQGGMIQVRRGCEDFDGQFYKYFNTSLSFTSTSQLELNLASFTSENIEQLKQVWRMMIEQHF